MSQGVAHPVNAAALMDGVNLPSGRSPKPLVVAVSGHGAGLAITGFSLRKPRSAGLRGNSVQNTLAPAWPVRALWDALDDMGVPPSARMSRQRLGR